MGVFDKNSLKYNDAIPNPNKEDGIDNIKCDNTECNCRDSRGYCLYETCVINLFNKIYNMGHLKIFNKNKNIKKILL